MTHEWELRNSPCHEESFQEIKKAFYSFFSGTQLGSTSISTLRKFFCRLSINGFSLNVRVKPHPDSCEEMGEVIYLNASRFNHSCRPTCLYRFDGARIVIEYIDYEHHDEFKPLVLTKEQFENLTLQYGFGTYWNFNSSCPLTEQRRMSLKSRYYFTCRCVLCEDKWRNAVQLDSAPLNCDICGAPYVWYRSRLTNTVKLKRSCKCFYDKTAKKEVARMAVMLFEKERRMKPRR